MSSSFRSSSIRSFVCARSSWYSGSDKNSPRRPCFGHSSHAGVAARMCQRPFPEYLGERCVLIVGEVAADPIFLLPPRNNFGQELAHDRFLRLALFRGFTDEQIHKGFLGLPFGSLEGQCGLQGGKAGEVVVPVAAVIEVKPDVFFHGIVVVEDEWVAAVE